MTNQNKDPKEENSNPPEHIIEAVNQLQGYIEAQSKAKMATGAFSGAEGNMLFKLSQIKQFLNIKD